MYQYDLPGQKKIIKYIVHIHVSKITKHTNVAALCAAWRAFGKSSPQTMSLASFLIVAGPSRFRQLDAVGPFKQIHWPHIAEVQVQIRYNQVYSSRISKKNASRLKDSDPGTAGTSIN